MKSFEFRVPSFEFQVPSSGFQIRPKRVVTSSSIVELETRNPGSGTRNSE